MHKRKSKLRAQARQLCKNSAMSPIERPYTYVEKINHLKATVELGFVIQDTSEAIIIPNVPIAGNPGESRLPSSKM